MKSKFLLWPGNIVIALSIILPIVLSSIDRLLPACFAFVGLVLTVIGSVISNQEIYDLTPRGEREAQRERILKSMRPKG